MAGGVLHIYRGAPPLLRVLLCLRRSAVARSLDLERRRRATAAAAAQSLILASVGLLPTPSSLCCLTIQARHAVRKDDRAALLRQRAREAECMHRKVRHGVLQEGG